MPPTSAQLLSRRDLDFLLHDWLHVEELTARPRFAEHSRDTIDALLDLAAEVAAERFAPHNKLSDANEPTFDGQRVRVIPEVKQALDVLAGTGILGATMDHEIGGLQLPVTVSTACSAWFQAANAATFAYAFLTVANANLLLAYGSPWQVDTFVRPMLEGRFHGTMCLSEPQSGSSLAAVATRAVPQDDGTHRVVGTKMWISAGEHELGENIVHLVLARTPDAPPGARGLSLFLVPKTLVGTDGSLGERNDVALAGLNHKMGYRGTTNAVLSFGSGAHHPGGRPGAVGYLVGPRNQGLACMFHMMNEARIGVGAGAAALGYTGYLKSLEYARLRTQGRRPTGPDAAPDAAGTDIPIIDHPDVRRMLLAQKCYAEGALALALYCGRLVDEERTGPNAQVREQAAELLGVLTPIAKSWPAQWCVAANDLAIQVLGGYGYSREYDVEQHYRDNRLNPIHEGTHGIQALDLLGRRFPARDGAGLAALATAMRNTVDRAAAAGGEAAELGTRLGGVLDRAVVVTTALMTCPEARTANATPHLEAVGHVVLAWIWLEQFLACGAVDDPFRAGKRQATRWFFRTELPRAALTLDLLANDDRTAAETDPSWF